MHYKIASGKTVCRVPPHIGEAKFRVGLTASWGDGPYTAGLHTKLIAQATVVDVSNVSQYYFETNPKPMWTLDEDFSGVVPPFEWMWFESPVPKRTYDFKNNAWVDMGKEISHFGVLVRRRDVSRDYLLKNPKQERKMKMSVPPIGMSVTEGEKANMLRAIDVFERDLGARWNVRMWGLTLSSEFAMGPWSYSNFYLDEKGDPIVDFPSLGIHRDREEELATTSSFMTMPPDLPEDLAEEWQRCQRAFRTFSDVAFLALSFMNCRNVSLREVPATPLKKKQQRRGDAPRVAHHVIEITPMKPRPVARYDMNVDADSMIDRSKKSLHIIRGHFKHYGEQWGTKKLFGRVSGKFWWDKHTAGSIDAGLIESDYAVKP